MLLRSFYTENVELYHTHLLINTCSLNKEL